MNYHTTSFMNQPSTARHCAAADAGAAAAAAAASSPGSSWEVSLSRR